MDSPDLLRRRLVQLREGFDQSFAEPPAQVGDPLEELLAIRIGVSPYALRLNEVAALEANRRITPVPSESAELLGVAGIRGAVVAVYDLAALLGQPRDASARWLGLAKGSQSAFAFSEFEGQLRVGREALSKTAEGSTWAVHEVARSGGVLRPVIGLASLVSSLEERARLGQRKGGSVT
jgi:chemotaxis signal transduction protein